MKNFLKRIHLYGLWRALCFFLINYVFVGTRKPACSVKRKLMRCAGFPVGDGTTIVGPIHVYGTIEIGKNCWCNRNLTVHGNGFVRIGDNCDIAPDVCFLTGGHAIGEPTRRAGNGETYSIAVGDGCWIGARATILGNTEIGKGCLIASCSCVTKDIETNSMVGGVPARFIKGLSS